MTPFKFVDIENTTVVEIGNIGPYKIVLYPVDVAKVSETNIRIVDRDKGLEYLAKNINEVGLFHFIWMTSKGNIYAGGRRWLAFLRGEREGLDKKFKLYKVNDKLHIPAIMYDCSEEMQTIISMAEGMHKETLGKDDYRYAGKFLMEKKGMSKQEVADFLGITKAMLDLYFISEELPDEVKKLIPKNTSIRRDRTIRQVTNVRGVKGDPELLKKAVMMASNLPIDIADAYKKQMELRLDIWDEVDEVKNNPRKFETLQIKMPRDFLGKFYGYLAEKRNFTFTKIIMKALEEYMEANP